MVKYIPFPAVKPARRGTLYHLSSLNSLIFKLMLITKLCSYLVWLLSKHGIGTSAPQPSTGTAFTVNNRYSETFYVHKHRQ